jgi:hypothetical protein
MNSLQLILSLQKTWGALRAETNPTRRKFRCLRTNSIPSNVRCASRAQAAKGQGRGGAQASRNLRREHEAAR